MTWLPRTAPGDTPFTRAFALCPELHARYQDFEALFWTTHPVDPALLELCRLRMAQILGCPAQAQPRRGVRDEILANLEDWRRSDSFSAVERACLTLAEKFVLDPHGVTDEDTAAVKAHLADKGLIAFVEALALFEGFLRFGAILDAENV